MVKAAQRLIWSICLAATVIIFSSATVQAASLYISPVNGAYKVGQNFSVGIYVSSADQAMNAVSGILSFPQDKLQVLSLAKTNSIISLWVQEPVFSNSVGRVNFEGIVLNPGFTGKAGRVITLTFKVKAVGSARLNFFSSSVLANDGQGTNILTGLGTGNYSLSGTVPTVTQPKTEAKNEPETKTRSLIKANSTPSAPRILSSTHPDPNKWYAQKDVKFSWLVPADVRADSLLVGKKPQSVPKIIYAPAVNSKELTNLDDGMWYFHVRLKNKFGWGDVAHFRFQIDTEKPYDFDLQEIARRDLTEPKVKFSLKAKDKTSGLDHYQILIDGQEIEDWRDDGSGIYQTPILSPGKHILIVRAVDKAGNALVNSAEFKIKALKAPIITFYPKKLISGQTLTVKGTTYAKAQVIIWLQRSQEEPKSHRLESDKEGQFTFINDEKLQNGIYGLWAEVVDKQGARSGASKKKVIVVKRPAILDIGNQALTILVVAVPLVALIIILSMLIWYGWYKFLSFKKKIHIETQQAERALERAIKLLRRDVEDQIKLLEKAKHRRRLTREEEKMIKRFKKDLIDVEKYVSKEIKDIEAELK